MNDERAEIDNQELPPAKNPHAYDLAVYYALREFLYMGGSGPS